MIEQRLPIATYKAEWSYLKPNEEARRYTELTTVELWVPRIFGFLYSVLITVGIVLSI